MKYIYLNPKKAFVAKLFCFLRFDSLFFVLQRILYKKNYIRAINYHDTPHTTAETFDKQLSYYKKRFTSVSYEDLEKFFKTKKWHKKKPGLIISFDDGLLSNYETALSILEKHDFIGWFFVPAEFINMVSDPKINNKEIWEWAEEHQIGLIDYTYDDKRIAMNWKELKSIVERGHVVGSHTKNHQLMFEGLSFRLVDDEILISKKNMEKEIGHEVPIFSWVGGEEDSYQWQAARKIKEAGYKYSFMTCSYPIRPNSNNYQLHRTNIEAFWPMALVKFQLCGVSDFIFLGRRFRVNRKTAV